MLASALCNFGGAARNQANQSMLQSVLIRWRGGVQYG